jgi:ketosteroid isomerase-like protein
MISTRTDAEKFAAEWAEAWNRRDVESVLAHFRDDVIFASPTALAVTGSPVVHGKDALRAYWTAALALTGSIRFSVLRVLWDAASRELAIIYLAEIDGRSGTVSENLIFDVDGLVATAEVFHGVPMSSES